MKTKGQTEVGRRGARLGAPHPPHRVASARASEIFPALELQPRSAGGADPIRPTHRSSLRAFPFRVFRVSRSSQRFPLITNY